MGPIRAIRSLGNRLGFAWWAKIETNNPNAIYWFGPFLTRRNLNYKVTAFVQDLSEEGIGSIDQRIVRCRKVEPLTS